MTKIIGLLTFLPFLFADTDAFKDIEVACINNIEITSRHKDDFCRCIAENFRLTVPEPMAIVMLGHYKKGVPRAKGVEGLEMAEEFDESLQKTCEENPGFRNPPEGPTE